MPTRRAMVLGMIATGTTGIAMQTRRARAKASQPETPVNFGVPAGACDCHTHIFGAVEQFPFFPGRVYTPEPALPDEMAALHRSLHVERVVIVTPSVYGTDNAATLHGMMTRHSPKVLWSAPLLRPSRSMSTRSLPMRSESAREAPPLVKAKRN